MKNSPVVISEVLIREGRAIRDDHVVYTCMPGEDFGDFSRSLYRKLNLSYPKFFKMDNLCKLAFLASELVLQDTVIREEIQKDRMAIILANRSSSLDTDRAFYNSIKDPGHYFPSPSVFVYTLPNISIGEICIRNGFTGEHAFFIFDQWNGVSIFEYVSDLFSDDRADACLLGWCDFDEGREDAVFLLCQNRETKPGEKFLTTTTMDQLYKHTAWQ